MGCRQRPVKWWHCLNLLPLPCSLHWHVDSRDKYHVQTNKERTRTMTYDFLQHYWWFIIALLGSILVFLLFVQGANSMIFQLGKTEEDRRILINSTGRKWEFTFTTLVTFGGAFFASFPLFYSTSFGGAYWVWLLILFTFIIQAISYEFQNKAGNIFGVRTFQTCLIINGLLGPFALGWSCCNISSRARISS